MSINGKQSSFVCTPQASLLERDEIKNEICKTFIKRQDPSKGHIFHQIVCGDLLNNSEQCQYNCSVANLEEERQKEAQIINL